METIHLHSWPSQNVTVISNDFLDRFLPKSNGEFLKIYLYLLRSAGKGDADLTVSGIADRMNCTETDIRRALRYWENEHILKITATENGDVTALEFLAPPEPEDTPLKKANDAPAVTETVIAKSSQVTTARMAELGEKEDIRELFFVAQQYLGRPLSRSEMQKICFFYDNLHFSVDLIDYLIDYCVSRGKTSFHYMEKVALNWKEQGITNVHEARVNVGNYHREYYDILKALGINNHHPVDAEIRLMKKWLEKYQFPLEIIEDACTKTLMGIGKPTLSYTDSILTRWHQGGVKTMADIERLDAEYQKKAVQSPEAKPKKKPANAFSEFEQRDYNYSELESQLLKKSTS